MATKTLLIKEYTADLIGDEKLQFQSEFTTRQRNTGAGIALALLVGGLGVHKFYLKKNTQGLVYALCGTFGWVIIIPPIIIGILCIVDAFKMEPSVVKFNNEIAREIKQEIEIMRS